MRKNVMVDNFFFHEMKEIQIMKRKKEMNKRELPAWWQK